MNGNDNNELSTVEKILGDISESKIGKVFKLFLEGTPYVNTVCNGIIGNIEKKKLIVYFQEWTNKKLDDKLQESNERQIEVVTHSILKSIRCSRDGQVRQIIAILKGTFDGNINSFDEAEDLINIVSELSQNEAIVLKKIYELVPKGKLVDYMEPAENSINTSQMDKNGQINCDMPCFVTLQPQTISIKQILKVLSEFSSSLAFYLGRLVGKGLLRKASIETFDDIGDKKYQYTYMGKKLFESIY